MRITLFVLLGAVLATAAVAQEARTDADAVRVNVTAEDAPVDEVGRQVSEQTGVQIAVTASTVSSLTGKLEDRTLEEAVRLLAEGAKASWMRVYLLETAAPELAYSAEELLEMALEAREDLFATLSDEQRRELMGAARRPRQDDDADPRPASLASFFEGPGGGIAVMEPAGDAAGGPRGTATMMARYDDPVRRLLLPGRLDEINLQLEHASLHDALTAFTMASGFLVIADYEIDGLVQLELADAPLSDFLDAVAEATGTQWRPVYILGQPRPLTEQEIALRAEEREQRREQRIEQMWAEFWARTPEERAQWIDRGVNAIERMGERMEEAAPERRQRMERFAGRVFERLVGYNTQLSPEQRQELKPILQAMARLRANE